MLNACNAQNHNIIKIKLIAMQSVIQKCIDADRQTKGKFIYKQFFPCITGKNGENNLFSTNGIF